MTEAFPKHLAWVAEVETGVDRALVAEAAALWAKLDEYFEGRLPEPDAAIAPDDGFVVIWSDDKNYLSISYQRGREPYAFFRNEYGSIWGDQCSSTLWSHVSEHAAWFERDDVDA